MKRLVLTAAALTLIVAQGASALPIKREPATAVYLSALIPGLGESYNSGFKNGFPWMECLLGTFIPFYRFSSMEDAAAGRSDKQMRFRFWSLPKE